MKFTYTQELELSQAHFYFNSKSVIIKKALGFTGLKAKALGFTGLKADVDTDCDYCEELSVYLELKVSQKVGKGDTYEVHTSLPLSYCGWLDDLLQGEFLSEEQVQKLITLINQINIID